MLKRRTVIIAGAGASYEFGIVMGDGLMPKIAGALDRNTDTMLMRAVTHVLQSDGGRIYRACRAVQDGMEHASSIDRFLHTHSDDQDVVSVGKLAIAATILKEENTSTIGPNAPRSYVPQAQSFPAPRLTWLGHLFRSLQEDVKVDSPSDIFRQLTIVTFNYDRVIETYLRRALIGYFRLDDASANGIMSTLPVLHAYGSIGPMAWQGQTALEFGLERHFENTIIAAAKRIFLFTDGEVDDSAAQQTRIKIREAVEHAERIIILGCSYFPQNLELLRPLDPARGPEVLGTNLGMSEWDIALTEEALLDVLKPQPNYPGPELRLLDLTAAELMKRYGRTLYSK